MTYHAAGYSLCIFVFQSHSTTLHFTRLSEPQCVPTFRLSWVGFRGALPMACASAACFTIRLRSQFRTIRQRPRRRSIHLHTHLVQRRHKDALTPAIFGPIPQFMPVAQPSQARPVPALASPSAPFMASVSTAPVQPPHTSSHRRFWAHLSPTSAPTGAQRCSNSFHCPATASTATIATSASTAPEQARAVACYRLLIQHRHH